MKNLTSLEIRQIWINYFTHKNHYYLKSSSLLPNNDNSLLWINSGIAVLKKYFEGTVKPPSNRIVNIQKSLRTNDVNNVGVTSRHHTFFEMLGNFSIGDYFKEEAISMGLDILTNPKYYDIDLNKLYFTIFNEDNDALKIYKALGVNEDRIIKMDKSTNFWDMGVGPCGPSTEIFFDRGDLFDVRDPVTLIKDNIENDRVIEIWNIVFSQLNNNGKNEYTNLKHKNIDTGAGLERFASIFQNTPTNFETDLFLPIIKEIERLSNKKYLRDYIPNDIVKNNISQSKINVAIKKIADFSRAIVYGISDGAIPSPGGSGYIIRKLIRKSFIIANSIDINEPFIYKLVNTVININKDYYNYDPKTIKNTISIIKIEEVNFINTYKLSVVKFNELLESKGAKNIIASDLFKLHETNGLPKEFIYEYLKNNSLVKFNIDEFKKLEINFKNASKLGSKFGAALSDDFINFVELKNTKFEGYDNFENGIEARVLKIHKNQDNKILVALDKTILYATSGGQLNDMGYINECKIYDVIKNKEGLFLHYLDEINFKVGDIVNVKLDLDRRESLTINHSAIHLLFAATEKILDSDIDQIGSKVDLDFFRFDLKSKNILSSDIIKKIEDQVNTWIKTNNNRQSNLYEDDFESAKKSEIKFLKNKKYPKRVRVVDLHNGVVDLCSGTHVKYIDQIEKIKIVKNFKKTSETLRIEAIATINKIKRDIIKTNKDLYDTHITGLVNKINLVKENNSTNLINIDDLEHLLNNIKKLDLKSEIFASKFNKIKIEILTIISSFQLKFENNIIDSIKDKKFNLIVVENMPIKNFFVKILEKLSTSSFNSSKVILLVSHNNGKYTFCFFLTKDLSSNSNLISNIKNIAMKFGLRGGGSRQIYTYGGSISEEAFSNLSSDIKKWEF